MNLSRESSKHFSRLCESILRRYDIADRDQLRKTLQTELMVTLDRVLDGNSLVRDEYDMFPQEGVAVISAPLNSLEDIARNGADGKVEVYIRVPYYLDEPDTVTGDQGEEFLNVRSVPRNARLFVGSLAYTPTSCSFVASDDLDPSLIDLDMYATCWNTDDPRNVCRFLNDIFSRVSKKGVYVTSNSLTSPTNDYMRHVSYGKLLCYAKSLYPMTVGNESSIMRSILADLLGLDVQEVSIDRMRDDVGFVVILDDNNREAIETINARLEEFV